MSIFEYDQEKHMKFIKEEGCEEGREDGREEAQNKMLMLLKYMENNNEMHLISKLQDKDFLYEMYTKYNL